LEEEAVRGKLARKEIIKTTKQMSKKELKISASRIKTKKTCSNIYFGRYHLRLPDETNNGALMGTCIHTVFEHLTKEKHKKLFESILAARTIGSSKLISRYVKNYMAKYNLPDECLAKIDGMVLTGLSNDFLCKGGQITGVELKFDIKGRGYRIYGLIDRLVEYERGYVRIQDWKSSSKLFTDYELKESIQAKMYALAARTLRPNCKPIVDFLMLQFGGEGFTQRARFSDEELNEFEEFLAKEYEEMSNFTEEDSVSDLAANQGFPKPQEGFSGRLVCGRSNYPGEMKKDGSKPLWACSLKFKFDYFALCDDDGEVIKTSKKDDLVPKLEKGEFVIKKKYGGCPAFKNLAYNQKD